MEQQKTCQDEKFGLHLSSGHKRLFNGWSGVSTRALLLYTIVGKCMKKHLLVGFPFSTWNKRPFMGEEIKWYWRNWNKEKSSSGFSSLKLSLIIFFPASNTSHFSRIHFTILIDFPKFLFSPRNSTLIDGKLTSVIVKISNVSISAFSAGKNFYKIIYERWLVLLCCWQYTKSFNYICDM